MSYVAVALSSATDDWATPPEIFARLDREFGPFELDVAASSGNAKCPRFYTVHDDGLKQPWTGRVWMNPPYGRGIDKWIRKAAESAATGALVVCLVPARPDTRWWRDAQRRAALTRMLPGRLRFGDGSAPAPFPSAVLVFGQLPGRHGTQPARCFTCSSWWFPPRSDAKTCSPRCRQALRRSRISRPTCDMNGSAS